MIFFPPAFKRSVQSNIAGICIMREREKIKRKKKKRQREKRKKEREREREKARWRGVVYKSSDFSTCK